MLHCFLQSSMWSRALLRVTQAKLENCRQQSSHNFWSNSKCCVLMNGSLFTHSESLFSQEICSCPRDRQWKCCDGEMWWKVGKFDSQLTNMSLIIWPMTKTCLLRCPCVFEENNFPLTLACICTSNYVTLLLQHIFLFNQRWMNHSLICAHMGVSHVILFFTYCS